MTRRRERRWRKLVNSAYRAYRCNWPGCAVTEKAGALACALGNPLGDDKRRRVEMARFWALIYSGRSTRRLRVSRQPSAERATT
jgi:hypothetical protein